MQEVSEPKPNKIPKLFLEFKTSSSEEPAKMKAVIEAKIGLITQKLDSFQIKEAFFLLNSLVSSLDPFLQDKSIEETLVNTLYKANYQALDCLYQREFHICRKILWKSEEILRVEPFSRIPELKVLVFNNIGCYYKALEKNFEGLMYFQKALSFVENGMAKTFHGYTFLNMSIILSLQERSEESSEFARKAINSALAEFDEISNRVPLAERQTSKNFQLYLNVLLSAYERIATSEEQQGNYKASLEYREKSTKLVLDQYGRGSKIARNFQKILIEFKKRHKILFQNELKTKKKKKMQKKNLEMNISKLKPYFDAYNITPKDLYFTGKVWAFKTVRRSFDINLTRNEPLEKPRNREKSDSVNPNLQTLTSLSKPLSLTSRENQPNGNKPLFFRTRKTQIRELPSKPKEKLPLEKIDLDPTVENFSNDDNFNGSRSFVETQEFLNIDVKESFTENRKEFLINLKDFDANRHANPNENTLDFSKAKIIENSSVPPKKKNSGVSTKNEKSDGNNNSLNPNNNNNQLKIPKNLPLKPGDLSSKSAFSNSPISNSNIKYSLTPKRGKMSITIKKLNRPSFVTKTPKTVTKETRDKAVKLIQRKFRLWFRNQENLKKNFKIIFHSPSHEMKVLEKSPTKKSKAGLDLLTSLEKNSKGSLLIIYYRRRLEVRAVFKLFGPPKKLHYHFFDFVSIEKFDENLKEKVISEFFKEMVKSFCIFYDDILMLKELLSQKPGGTHTLKMTRFVFQELILEKKDENATIIIINQNTKKETFISTQIDENSLDIDPLFGNPLNNLSFDRIEPLLYFMPISDINLKENPSPIMKGSSESISKVDRINPVLINLKLVKIEGEENQNIENVLPINEEKEDFINQITQNRFNNIRVFSTYNANDNPEEKSESDETWRKLELLKRQSESRKQLLKMKDAVSKIQAFYRHRLFKLFRNFKKIKNLEIKGEMIKKKGDSLVWVRILQDVKKKSHYVYATFIERLKPGARKKEKSTFKIDIPKDLAIKIMDSPVPFVWLQINPKLKMISFRNMQIYDRMLSRFEKIISSKLRYWKSIFFQSLNLRLSIGFCFKKLLSNIQKHIEFQRKIIKANALKQISLFAAGMKRNSVFFMKIEGVFKKKMCSYSRILVVRLKLLSFLPMQIQKFSERVEYFIALAKQRANYKQAIKVLAENSRFKDYIPIKKRLIFENRRTINVFIYYNPSKWELLMISEDSDIQDYIEILEHDVTVKEATENYLKDKSKEIILKKIIEGFTANITLIKKNSKSLEKSFKLYSQKCLESALFLQKHILKKVYYKVFEICDKEYEYRCRVCVRFITEEGVSRIILLLKTLPTFVKNIYDFPDNCLDYLLISEKMSKIESFVERFVSFNERKGEFVFIPPSNKKWIIKKKKEIFVQGIERTSFELGAEIDYLNNKISIRMLKDENKFYKFLIPEHLSIPEKKTFISNALDSCFVYKDEDKLRLISDDDKYGPLIHKAKFETIEGKKIDGTLRIIDSKKYVIFLTEWIQNKSLFSVSSLRFPFVNDDQKLKLIEKMKTSALESITFNVDQGVSLDDLFYSECIALCNPAPENTLKMTSQGSKSEQTSPNFKQHSESSDIKTSEKSFSRNRAFSRKAPARSFLTKDSKSHHYKAKKPKEVFEKESLPSENQQASPKFAQKKELNAQFSTLLDTRTMASLDKIGDTIEENKGENVTWNENSPLSRSSNSQNKSELLSPEVKDFSLNSAPRTIKKGISLKTMDLESKEKKDQKASNLNNSNNPISFNEISTGSGVFEKRKADETANKTKENDDKELENAAKMIQRRYRQAVEKREIDKRKIMLNAEVVEVSKNRMHFPNPRRPCDYDIVVCKDPDDVLNAILFLQATFRKWLNLRRKDLKKEESLNEAKISVNCEESNLESIKSVSFLEQLHNDEEKDFYKTDFIEKSFK